MEEEAAAAAAVLAALAILLLPPLATKGAAVAVAEGFFSGRSTSPASGRGVVFLESVGGSGIPSNDLSDPCRPKGIR